MSGILDRAAVLFKKRQRYRNKPGIILTADDDEADVKERQQVVPAVVSSSVRKNKNHHQASSSSSSSVIIPAWDSSMENLFLMQRRHMQNNLRQQGYHTWLTRS
jgi:DNA-binding NarL/FixJ family response regulator